ncbi:MAG: tryptophan-rich sensory protein [Candidatus Thorarchaeota archaeon]
MTNNYKKFQIINIIAVVATIVMNSLANILPFNGVNTGEVADVFFSYFTPAGYVFSIWGVIYTLLIIFILYQARTSQVNEEYLGSIGYLYLIAAFFNITWLLAFHYAVSNSLLLLLTEPLILGLLITLLYTYVKLEIGATEVSLSQKIAVHLPISVYTGWLSVATIANTASVLNYFLAIPVETQYLWTALVLVVALLLAIIMLAMRKDIAYALVVVWAAIGIYVKWTTVEVIPLIYWTALAVVIVTLVAIVVIPLIKRKNPAHYYLVRT